MLATEHTRAVQQARTHIHLAAELMDMPARRGYEAASRFYINSKELAEFNLGRAIRAHMDPVRYGNEAALERRITTRALQSGAARRGIGLFVPFAVLQRDLVVGTANSGGHLVGSRISDAAAWLRPTSACAAAGATFLSNLNETLSLPRFSDGIAAGVVGESVVGQEGSPSFEAVSLSPKTIVAYVDYSRRLGLQANEDISAMLSADLASAVGEVVDRMAINGSGTADEPLGILNTPDIGSVAIDVNGGPATWSKIVDLEYEVSNKNAAIGAMGYVTTPKVQKQLKKTETFTGAGVPIWGHNPTGDNIGGVPAWASNNVPGDLVKGSNNDCSALIYGNWADLIVGVWGGGVEVLVDKYTNGTVGGTRLVVYIDIDVGVRRPGSFAAMKDIRG